MLNAKEILADIAEKKRELDKLYKILEILGEPSPSQPEEPSTPYPPPVAAPTLPAHNLRLDGLPTREAARQYLMWAAGNGRNEVQIGEVFEALKPYRILTAKGKNVWELKDPWKQFTNTIAAPNNQKLFHCERIAAHYMISDLVSLAKGAKRK